MTDLIQLFRNSLPYINAHRGKTLVIALSGEAIESDKLTDITHDIAMLYSLGIRVVLIHGARPQVNERLKNLNIEPQYDGQIRITDKQTLDCVKDAVGHTRITVESMLSMGLPNSPMHKAKLRVTGGNFITAKPLGVRNGVDYCHTGEIRKLDKKAIRSQLDSGALVLISPLGYSPTGEAFNLTLEEVASQVAISLQAEKLVYYIDQDGIANNDGEVQSMIPLAELKNWQDRLDPDSQLHEATRAAYLALQNGVQRCHLINYKNVSSLLIELFTRDGSGTLILKESREIIREADIRDVQGIIELIGPLEETGVLVRRSRKLLETEISHFLVTVHPEGMIIACAALYPIGQNAGELACVAIHPEFRNLGLAGKLLEQVESLARQQRMTRLFALTTQAAHWFIDQGFEESSVEDLPSNRKSLYNQQRNSKVLCKTL